MDEGKILIMNFSKGRIGEDNSALLGAMMITKIQLAAMERVDIPEKDRKDSYLYVDEFQNFATESFANILSEARKYRLNLILANQYISQLDEKVRDAIFGNAGTLVTFRVGAADAEFMEKEFAPIFTMNDLVNLPKYTIYLKLMIDGIAGDAFSASTLSPLTVAATDDSTEKVIKVSRQRYTSTKEIVEDKIARWSGMVSEKGQFIPPKEEETALPAATPPHNVSVVASEAAVHLPKPHSTQPQEKMPQVERQMYEAVCATCEKQVLVPFKPDGRRPTFCKDCLRDYQSTAAKTRVRDAKENEEVMQPMILQQPHGEQKKEEKIIERKTFVSHEAPLSLSQLKHVAPKKFNKARNITVDLSGVRHIINQNMKKEEK